MPRCTANDLRATARAHIALRYADDLRLYAERCDAEALVKARADAPKGVEPIPAPYTWVQTCRVVISHEEHRCCEG